MAERDLPPAPHALDAGGGRPLDDGRYAGAVRNLDTSAWDGSGFFSRRRLQRKGWVYFGCFSPRYMVGYAIADAGLVATAFVYVYDREKRTLIEEKMAKPFGFASSFAPDWRGAWRLGSGGRQWQVDYASSKWQVRFTGKRLRVELDCEDHGRGLTAVSAAPGRPFAHTYKLCALPARLKLTVDGETCQQATSCMLDFTLGYPPRSTLWNWASAEGTTREGRPFALNLVAHFMNGLENALWTNDRVVPLSQAVFRHDRSNLLSPWRIHTEDGRVDLTFTPEGRRMENLRAGVLASVFSQPFGKFEGKLVMPEGPTTVQAYGVVEEHSALW